MGSAAARYLSRARRVAVVGPAEPMADEATADVFASHYDQGRITHRFGKDIVWAHLAQRAIGEFDALAAALGRPIHFPVGGVSIARPDAIRDRQPLLSVLANTFDIAFRFTEAGRETEPFPIAVPAGFGAIHEPPPAGYINPRDLLAAQLAVARDNGATLVRDVVTGVRPRSDGGYDVETRRSGTLRSQRVLVAAGAYTNTPGLLPATLSLRVKSETITLARVGAAETHRLRAMPFVLYAIEDPAIDDIYLLPPIQYPDGAHYVKLGSNTAADLWLEDAAAMRRWMRAGESDVSLAPQRRAIEALIPGLAAEAFQTRRCLVTYTAHGKPYIGRVADGHFVAAGGNGSSAKAADTLGYLAALTVTGQPWPAPFAPDDFAPVWA